MPTPRTFFRLMVWVLGAVASIGVGYVYVPLVMLAREEVSAGAE